MRVNIRRATQDDAGLVAQLNGYVQSWHAASYPQAFHATPDPAALSAYFAARLAEPEVTCFLAGQPSQGYALCVLMQRPQSVFSPAVSRLMVEHIAVAPLVRRQGVGAALLAAARDLAQTHGCDEIMLDTWEGNHDAHAFFAAQGFAVRRMLFRAVP